MSKMIKFNNSKTIGQRAMNEVLKLADRYACHDITVLITGETGTGKDVIGRYIHAHSPRKDETFVACNITAIPETLVESELFGYSKGAFTGADKNKRGLIEAAEKGTLFLDEIGDLSPLLQVKLLRFLESREFYKVGDSSPKIANVRIIASTNYDFDKGTNGFRKDLYYRVNSASISLPPLRERGDDITLLAENFVMEVCSQSQIPLKKISSSVNILFLTYPWPGNIRELKNTIESSVLVSDGTYLTVADLPMKLQRHATNNQKEIGSFRNAKAQTIEQFERSYLTNLLSVHRGNITWAAKQAGKDRRGFQRLLRKYSLDCAVKATKV